MSASRVQLLDLADEPDAVETFVGYVGRLTVAERIAFADTMDALAGGLKTFRQHGTGKRASALFDEPRVARHEEVAAWVAAGGKAALKRWVLAAQLTGTAANSLERHNGERLARLDLVFRAMPARRE
jgi:hypothetical protein